MPIATIQHPLPRLVRIRSEPLPPISLVAVSAMARMQSREAEIRRQSRLKVVGGLAIVVAVLSVMIVVLA